MYVCESQFNVPDKNILDIYLHEVDWYAWIPKQPLMPNHRLSLRKRISTGNFEVYRAFMDTSIIRMPGVVGVSLTPNGRVEQIVHAGPSLADALEAGNREAKKYHGDECGNDQVCEHRYPNIAAGCKVKE